MNAARKIQKPSEKERVTIVMVPYEQYSTFPRAIDLLYKSSNHPFDLIVVEGNAPDSIKSALERRKNHHGNIKIIYTNHLPLACEARNLALPHIRTHYAFLMDNDVRVSTGWLTNLVNCIQEKNVDVVCPVILNTQNPTYALNGDSDTNQQDSDINSHGFLITKEALERLGEIDENISSFAIGLDLGMKIKTKNMSVYVDRQTCLKRDFPFAGKPNDKKLFILQWDLAQAQRSFAYLRQKWGIELNEEQYLYWLENKQKGLQKASPYLVKSIKDDLHSKANFARLRFKRFFHTFISL